jgi:hypothetical protein
MKGLFPDGHGTKSLRQLANTLNINAGNLHRLIKQAESAGLLRTVSDKYGTYFEIQNPEVLSHRQHLDQEEEEVFNKQLPLPYGKRFLETIENRNLIDGIFWGCLVAGRDVDELSGTTIRFLVELPNHRSPGYVAGLMVKYIREARHPLSFLRTVFSKESDPLSQAEITRGQEALDAGAELLRNIDRLDELGLNGIRNFTRLFAGLESEMGRTLESVRSALEALKEKRSKFLTTWAAE